MSRTSLLVLLMAVIYKVHSRGDLIWHDINSKLHDNYLEYSNNIEVITSKI
jgi:hypothetical protein